MEKLSGLQAGDFVVLNSGGPDMRVINPAEQVLSVEYIDDKGLTRHEYFPKECVRKKQGS